MQVAARRVLSSLAKRRRWTTPAAIYRIITDAYVNDLKSSPAAALDKMDKADALFEGWLAAVRASS